MRVGVTGIFASGKGTVCAMFEELGARVIDTDIVAREVVEPGSEGYKKMIEEFGTDFIRDDGSLDRRAFANHVFSDIERVRRLNAITHPLIAKTVNERSDNNDINMINTPLLFESGFNEFMDRNIVVVAEVDQVLERGEKRDSISTDEIRERLKFQIPLNEKIKLADYIIDNSGSIDNTKRQVRDLWKILTELKEK